MTRPSTASSEPIRSRQNARLKDLRHRLLRPGHEVDGLIAVEGEHLVEEAVRSGLRIDTLFLREDREEHGVWRVSNGANVLTVARNAFDQAVATESPQGIAAVVEAPRWRLEDLLETANPVLLVIAGLQDPGNLGTILRTAEAFGATGALLTPGTVNPWNQKAIRASAGSSFRLPHVLLETDSTLDRLRKKEIPLYATAARGNISVLDANLRAPIAFVIGNEGNGIPKQVLRFCLATIHVPCSGPVESLNASVAASILLFEASRQRATSSEKKS